MRLFIAINFNEEIKNRLFEVIVSLKKAAVKGSFTHKDNLHLTLVFIGESNKTEIIKKAMDQVKAVPFELMIEGLGCFKRDGGDIYWAGLRMHPVLNEIYQQLVKELSQTGFSIDQRAYKPHLTLGREVRLSKDFDEKEFGENIPRMVMPVETISLMKSERINGKLTYTEIYRKKLC